MQNEPQHCDHLPNMLFVPHLLPKQHWPVEAWTLPDLIRCPVVSGINTLAADPSSYLGYEVELPWIKLVWSSIYTTNQLRIWRGHSKFELFVMFFKPHPNNACSSAGCFILLKEGFSTIVIDGCTWYKQCLDKQHVTNFPLIEGLDLGFPSRTLPIVSHSS